MHRGMPMRKAGLDHDPLELASFLMLTDNMLGPHELV